MGIVLPAPASKRVFQRQLQLAHGDSRPCDGSEAAGQHVAVRRAPDGMVQDIERLEAELQLVAFFIRHAEFLVRRKIQREELRPDEGVAPHAAEVSGRVRRKRRVSLRARTSTWAAECLDL